MSSVYIAHAIELRTQARLEFEDYRLAAYEQAAEACRDALLNERGRRAGIDPYSLFMGNEARAMAYASDELKEWWRSHRRPTFKRFERDHYAGWLNEYAPGL